MNDILIVNLILSSTILLSTFCLLHTKSSASSINLSAVDGSAGTAAPPAVASGAAEVEASSYRQAESDADAALMDVDGRIRDQ